MKTFSQFLEEKLNEGIFSKAINAVGRGVSGVGNRLQNYGNKPVKLQKAQQPVQQPIPQQSIPQSVSSDFDSMEKAREFVANGNNARVYLDLLYELEETDHNHYHQNQQGSFGFYYSKLTDENKDRIYRSICAKLGRLGYKFIDPENVFSYPSGHVEVAGGSRLSDGRITQVIKRMILNDKGQLVRPAYVKAT